jgi:hypothetical protein
LLWLLRWLELVHPLVLFWLLWRRELVCPLAHKFKSSQ